MHITKAGKESEKHDVQAEAACVCTVRVRPSMTRRLRIATLYDEDINTYRIFQLYTNNFQIFQVGKGAHTRGEARRTEDFELLYYVGVYIGSL